MASGVTYQALDRLTYLPTRTALKNGDCIAGQLYYDVFFTGGEIENVTLTNCTFVPPVSGGSDITSQQTLSSGSTATAIMGQIVLCNSASGAPKTITPPTATGSFGIVEIVDQYGDAYANPITFNGTVIGGLNTVYTNNGSARFRDVGTNLWANV